MLKPKIVVTGEDSSYGLFLQLFASLEPRSMQLQIGNFSAKILKIHSSFDHTDHPKDLDVITNAPHALIYVFQCNHQQEYIQKYQEKIKSWYRLNSRPYIDPICIFINDPKQTKSKNIFSGFSNFYAQLEKEIPNLFMVLYKPSGHLCKKDLRKLWQTVCEKIALSCIERIRFIGDILDTEMSFEVIKAYCDLSLLYEQISMYNEAVSLTQKGLDLIDRNPNFFSLFFSNNSLTYPLDFSQPADQFESSIIRNSKAEYDFRYILFKRQIQNLQYLLQPNTAIQFGWMFITSICSRSAGIERPASFQGWLCCSLYDLAGECMKEKELGKLQRFDIYCDVLQYYIKELPELYDIIQKNSKCMKGFATLNLICATRETFIDEIKSKTEELIEVSRSSGFRRVGALAALKLREISQSDTDVISATTTILTSGFPELIGDFSPGMLRSLPLENRIHASVALLRHKSFAATACASLTDVFSGSLTLNQNSIVSSENSIETNNKPSKPSLSASSSTTKINLKSASGQFNTISTSSFHLQSGDREITVKAAIPFRLIFKSVEFTQLQNVALEAEIDTPFEGWICAPSLRVGFAGPGISIVYLSANDVAIGKGQHTVLRGVFRNPGSYSAAVAHVSGGGIILPQLLPPSSSIIRISPLPLPIDVAIAVPAFILPDRWQHALLKITASRPLERLELSVNGVQHSAAPLQLEGGGVLETGSLTFSDVPAGRHSLFLPVYAKQSGVLRVEAIAGVTVSTSAAFSVSNFLEVKVSFRERTRTAMLGVLSREEGQLEIVDVVFYGADGTRVGARAVGLPLTVGREQAWALFETDGAVDSADVFIRQGRLQPFSLRLRVESLAESKPKGTQTMPPLTPFVPINYHL